MKAETNPFLLKEYTDAQLSHFLASAGKNSDAYEKELMYGIECLCSEEKWRIWGCVVGMDRESCVAVVGTHLSAAEMLWEKGLSEQLSELEIYLNKKGWESFYVSGLPIEPSIEELRNFCTFSMGALRE